MSPDSGCCDASKGKCGNECVESGCSHCCGTKKGSSKTTLKSGTLITLSHCGVGSPETAGSDCDAAECRPFGMLGCTGGIGPEVSEVEVWCVYDSVRNEVIMTV